MRSEAPHIIEHRFGIVMALDHSLGTLSLMEPDGGRIEFHADPAILRGLRIGDPVQVLVEGTTIRVLRPR